MSFTRVLIANRGEIAIRVAKAAEALGIDTVAVHAPVDERSLHLVAADRVAPLPGSDPLHRDQHPPAEAAQDSPGVEPRPLTQQHSLG